MNSVVKKIVEEIEYIQFGISSPEEIISKSVCEITDHKPFGTGSVYDLRMGSIDQRENCVSCGKSGRDCVGHSGHLQLNAVVIHPMFLRQITNILKCLCIKCYRVVLSRNHLFLEGIIKSTDKSKQVSSALFEKMVERLEKIDSCFYCNAPKPKITIHQKTSEIIMAFNNKKVIMTDVEIKKIFDSIPDEDIYLLGFTPQFMHPKNLIITVLEIMPPRARPYIIMDGVMHHDDITISIIEIIKANRMIGDSTISESKKEKAFQTLKFRIKTMMNNAQGKAKAPNNKPLKCIKTRISGKEGIIRKHLLGKRRNQSGRSVISADPFVRTDELVIPPEMASNLTMPITVNQLNQNYLSNLIANGKANRVIKTNGNVINLKYATINQKAKTNIEWGDMILRNNQEINPFAVIYNTSGYIEKLGGNILADEQQKRLNPRIARKGDQIKKKNGEIIDNLVLLTPKPFHVELGDVVERHMLDNDIVLFNRQPTLHSNSMLAKRILVKPGRTLRFNLASTKGFNADFDGDEMNIFLPQNPEAIAELVCLSNTRHHIMTTQSTKNIIAVSQDSLLSAFLMTREDIDLGKELFFHICMRGDFNENIGAWTSQYIIEGLQHIERIMKENNKNFPLYSGKSLFSLMFPKTLSYTRKNDARKDEPVVIIKKGVLLEGALNKAILGSGHNTLIHVLYKEYGKDCALYFINNAQFIPNEYLLNKSFSIGIEDCFNRKMTPEDIEAIAYKAFLEAKELDQTITHPQLKELKVCAILDKARDIAQKSVKDSMIADKTNGFVATVTSGCKGEYFNITQITSMLGQQMHMAKRIEKTLNNASRVISHYPDPSEISLEEEFESRGFIKHSFLHGLTPQEFIWHAMSAREGCTCTSLNTATSGYVQRKMAKLLEDIQVKYDGTVRDVNNAIVQWAYGNDGFDRHEMAFKNNDVQFSDCNMIAERLNSQYENSLY